MLAFFRKIRQKFLKEGKLASYLTYALGEIVLVVIGILIALWLNNLNHRLDESERRRQLKISLVEELRENREICANHVRIIKKNHEHLMTILHISTGKPTSLPIDSIMVLATEMIPSIGFGLNESRITSAKEMGAFSLLSLEESDAIATYERTLESYKESRHINNIFTPENRELFLIVSLTEKFHKQLFPDVTLAKHPDYALSPTEFLAFLKKGKTHVQLHTILTSIMVDINWLEGLQTEINDAISILSSDL